MKDLEQEYHELDMKLYQLEVDFDRGEKFLMVLYKILAVLFAICIYVIFFIL